MVAFNFTVPIYGFDQWSAAASTNNTVSYPNGTTFTLDATPVLTVIDVQDDDGNPADSPDNLFDDGFIDTPGDGSAPSTANNDQVLTQPVTINGQSFNVGDQVELEFAFTTTSGDTFWIIRIDGVNVGISGPVLPVPGTTYTVNGSSDGQATPIEDVPCFTDGALVETPSGPVVIEDLNVGDLVLTVDHGPQPILWVGQRKVSVEEMRFMRHLRPIIITPGSLGSSFPKETLALSRNHRIVLQSLKSDLLFGEREMLAPAKFLVNGRTIFEYMPRKPIVYRHLLLAKHEVLIVNGLPAESLYPGTGALTGDQLLELDLVGHDPDQCFDFARPTLRSYETCLLVA